MATTILTTIATIALLRFIENLIMEWRCNRTVTGGLNVAPPVDTGATWISKPERLPVHMQATRKSN